MKQYNAKHTTSQMAVNKPQRRFQFIDNSSLGQGSPNSTQVRRHVMQEYMRAKRWENKSHAEEAILNPDRRLDKPHQRTTPRRKPIQRVHPSRRPSVSGSHSNPSAMCAQHPEAQSLGHLSPVLTQNETTHHSTYRSIQGTNESLCLSEQCRGPYQDAMLAKTGEARSYEANRAQQQTPTNTINSKGSVDGYIFSGCDGHGPSFYFDHASAPRSSGALEAVMIGRKEVAQQCEEFIVFLKCTEQLARVTARLQHQANTQYDQKLRFTVFRPEEPLYKVLASPNETRYTSTGQLKQIISRLAALMTINTAIWEYRYSTAISEEFLDELVNNIKYNSLDEHISVEALLQILLSGSQNPNLLHTERPWLVSRLLKVAKRLSRSSWERLNDFLLGCLTLNVSSSPIMDSWEQELRVEILSAPPMHTYCLPCNHLEDTNSCTRLYR